MVKLFLVHNLHKTDKWFCFAHDGLSAIKLVIESLGGKKRRLYHEDVTKTYLDEDGVKFLIEKNFVGIPERSTFMLNCCVQAQESHYNDKKRSGTLFWSKDIPGSKEIWS